MRRVLILAILAVVLPLAGMLLGLDPWTLHPDQRLAEPSPAHPLGQDELGRDVMARLCLGFALSVLLAGASAGLSTGLGASLGIWAGTRGGWVDAVLSRVMELTQSIPKLPLLLLIGSIDLRHLGVPIGVGSVALRLVLLFTLLGWLTAFRVARQTSLEVAARPFVEAARVLGVNGLTLLSRHVLPHVGAPIRVVLAISFGEFVLLESGLSFLGLGVPAPWPSLGNLMAQGATSGGASLVLAPGLATAAMLWWVGARIDPQPRASSLSTQSRQMSVEALERPR